MGGFAQGFAQGQQNTNSFLADLEMKKQQAEMFKLKHKQLKLETDMAEQQMAAMRDLPNQLFGKPQQMPVTAQGPGAPVQLPVEESDDFLRSMTPGEQASGRWLQEVQERGPGAFKEGPQPTGMADIPGTAGPLYGVSPQLQDVFRQMLVANGGNMGAALQTMQQLGIQIGQPAQPTYAAFDQDKDIFQTNAPGGMKMVRQGVQKPKEKKPVPVGPGHVLKDPETGANIGDPVPAIEKPENVKADIIDVDGIPHQIVMNDQGQKLLQPLPGASQQAKTPRPTIKEVDTPEGKQFVSVTEEGVKNIGQPIKTAPAQPKAIDTEQAIAMEMFGQDYASLARPAQAEVNKRIKQDKLDLYRAQADVMVAAAGERERNKQTIPEKPSGQEREKLIGGLNTLDQLNEVASLYDPSLVGPATGGMSEFRAIFPEKWGGLSPQQARLYGALATFKNRLTNLISGAAVSPDEAARLAQEMPQANQEPAVFEQRWVQSWRNAQNLAARQRQVYGETGVDVSGVSPLPQPHKRFNNQFAENIFPSTVVGPPQNGPKAKAAEQADPRIQQLGPGGKLGYEAAADKQDFLDRYFKTLEKTRHAGK